MRVRNVFWQKDERIYQEVLEAVRWKQQEFEKQVNDLCSQYDVKIDNPLEISQNAITDRPELEKTK